MAKQFFYAELSGSPYEIGFGHGSKAKPQVLNSLRTYQDMFLTYSNVKWEDAKRASRQYIPYIEKYDPDMLEEMRGVADGAGLEFEDILAINARSEVITVMNASPKKQDDMKDGCTNIAVSPERTKDGNTLLGHNWDWKGSQRESIVILKMHQQNKPDILMITEAGIIGKFGVNEAGMGVAMNALFTASDAKGVPLHCILRGILNSVTPADAILAINGHPNACAANYMMAHGCGEVFDCERAPTDAAILYPEDGILVHANHLTDLKMRMKVDDKMYARGGSSFIRYGRAGKLIRQYDKIGPEELKTVLRDHAGFPLSICNHDDPRVAPGLRMCTVFTIILDLTNKTMEVCPVNPCEGEFYTVKL